MPDAERGRGTGHFSARLIFLFLLTLLALRWAEKRNRRRVRNARPPFEVNRRIRAARYTVASSDGAYTAARPFSNFRRNQEGGRRPCM